MPSKGDPIGKYLTSAVLGKGGMGEVLLGWDPDLRRNVAIKLMHRKAQGVENALRRFQQEAQVVARLSHPNVVQVYEFCPNGENPYIVMEYVPGESLSDFIERHAAPAFDLALDIARQMLAGLDAAHQEGIIHRDVKPPNVLRSDKGVVKLSDFGLARSLDMESGLTAEGTVVGTLHYLPPEVARGDPATAQSDLYSTGVTIYELLTGRVPFHDDSPLKLISKIAHEQPPPIQIHRNDIPPALAAWVGKLMAADPAHRYVSAARALADLDKLGRIGMRHDCSIDSDVSSESSAGYSQTIDSSMLEEETSAIPTPQPEDSAQAEASAPGLCLPEEELQGVIAEALRLQREGRNVLDEDALMEIAAEVGLSSGIVREAVIAYRDRLEHERRRKRTVRAFALAAAVVASVGVCVYWFTRPVAHRVAEYKQTGGGSGTVDVDQAVDAKAAPVSVGSDWTGLQITAREGQVLLARADGQIEIRTASGAAIGLRPGEPFYRSIGHGSIEARAVSGAARVAAATRSRLRLAVMPFTGGSGGSELGDLAVGIGDAVATRLAQGDVFEVVERVHIDQVIGNLQLENTEFFDPATAGRIGNLLGVEYVINGTIQKVGDAYRLSARRVESESGRALETAIVDATSATLFEAQDRLAADLLRRIIATECERFLGRPTAELD